jgi:hypothetical protein
MTIGIRSCVRTGGNFAFGRRIDKVCRFRGGRHAAASLGNESIGELWVRKGVDGS